MELKRKNWIKCTKVYVQSKHDFDFTSIVRSNIGPTIFNISDIQDIGPIIKAYNTKSNNKYINGAWINFKSKKHYYFYIEDDINKIIEKMNDFSEKLC